MPLSDVSVVVRRVLKQSLPFVICCYSSLTEIVITGKSTLCSAILNETLLESGDITLSGKVAYAAQSPWILNATLRDNILFGMPFDEKRYAEILDVCQLSHDLKMLDDGDMTEIGEKGINLSVSLGRTALMFYLYSD